jgi:ubiquinone/menaquinone biosynthesis C-methylase UbiE
MTIPENTSKNTHNVVASLLPLKENCRVLDIPSGAGAFTRRLMDKGIEVHSADIENILQCKNSNFMIADMNHQLPFTDGFFDAVVVIDGIEHLERPFDFVRECQRVIKPGGVIVLSTPNINALRSRWRWFWTSHHNKCKVPLNEFKPSPLHHINMMSYQRMRYILHTTGFSIMTVTTNRVKFISWLYAVFVPFSYLFTKFVFGKEEKSPDQRKANEQILKDLFSKPLLFGETMILSAQKN